MFMRPIIACIVCLLFCNGCCIGEKIGEAIGKSISEGFAQALTQNWVASLMDTPLTYAECAVFGVHGARPEFLPWYAGAEIARFAAAKLGLAPTSPLGLLQRLCQSLEDFRTILWDFLRWQNSVPDDES